MGVENHYRLLQKAKPPCLTSNRQDNSPFSHNQEQRHSSLVRRCNQASNLMYLAKGPYHFGHNRRYNEQGLLYRPTLPPRICLRMFYYNNT